MQRGLIAWMTLATVVIVTVMAAVEAVPYPRSSFWDSADDESLNIERMVELLSQVNNYPGNRDSENAKRGLDLGLGRGYSGSQTAKHLMGLAAANYAGGPGRRRRSEQA